MFNCQNREVEKVLRRLCALCSAEGAYFHPEMKIFEENGSLKVMAPAPTGKQKLMQVPVTCLGAVTDFDLRVEGNHLALHGHVKGVSKSQVESFELLITIYNLCDKLKWHKKTSPWFALSEHPELLDFLLTARAGAKKIEDYKELYREKNWDKLLLRSFLGTRGFNLRNDSHKEGRQVLLAMIDFINHHSAAVGFKTGWLAPAGETAGADRLQRQFVKVHCSQPGTDSAANYLNECFVSYCRFDPLDSLLNYGFIDKSSRFFKSVAMEIDLLPGLRLQIDVRGSGRNQVKITNLQPGLRKLHTFMPAVISSNTQHIKLSHLPLPTQDFPFTPRFILPVLIKNHTCGFSSKQIIDAVIKAEAEIFARNRQFYQQLCEKVVLAQVADVNNPGLDMIKELAELQLERIKKITAV